MDLRGRVDIVEEDEAVMLQQVGGQRAGRQAVQRFERRQDGVEAGGSIIDT